MSQPLKVLIVDDDRDLRCSIADVLEDGDYLPLQAIHGADALRQLRSGAARPDVILLDVSMPVMDGPELRAALLGAPDLRRIPVIVLTADVEMERIASQMSADAFLKKPIRLDALLGTVARVSGRVRVSA